MKETIELLNVYFDKCAHCPSFLQGTCRYPWHKVPHCFFFLFSESDEDNGVSTPETVQDKNRFRRTDCEKQFKGAEFLNLLRYQLSWKDFYKTEGNPRCYLAALRKFSDKIERDGVYGGNEKLPFYFTRVSREGLNLCISFLDFHFLHHGDNILELIKDAFPEYTRDNGLFKIHPIDIASMAISKANVVTAKVYYKNMGSLPFDFKTGTVSISQESNVVPIPISSTRYNLESLMDVSLLDLRPVLPAALFKELATDKLDWVIHEIDNVYCESYQNEMQGIFGVLGMLEGKYSEKELKERIEDFIDIENVFNSYDFSLLARRILDLCLYDKAVNPMIPLTVFYALNVIEMKNMRMLFFDEDERINAEKRVLFRRIGDFYWCKVGDFKEIWEDCRKAVPYSDFISKSEWETEFSNALFFRKDNFPINTGMTPISFFSEVVSAQKQLKICLYGALILTQTRLDGYYKERTNLYGDVYDSDVAKMFGVHVNEVQYFTSMPDFNIVRKDPTEPDFIIPGAVPTEDFRMKVENFLSRIPAESKEQQFGKGEEYYTEDSFVEPSGGAPAGEVKKKFVFPANLASAKAYFDVLKNAGYLDEEYRWIKDNTEHKVCQAGWASRIIVGVFGPKVTHAMVGELLGFDHVGNLASRKATFENKIIEELFLNAKLKIQP